MTEPTPDPGRTVAANAAGASSETAGAGSGADRVAKRYGRAPRSWQHKWIGLALTVVVVLAGAGVAYLGWKNFGPKEIESEQLGYTVLDDSAVELRVRLTRADPTVPVVCIVRAMSRDLTEVGRREVLVEPSGDNGTVRFGTVIDTSSRASSALVYTCTDSVPGYLRTE